MKKGKCIGVFCDHKIDSETQSVFDMIERNEGKIDILVNNAFSGLDLKRNFSTTAFWEQDFVTVWEKTIDVGLRSAYIASCMALKMMVPHKSGLIVNISSIGGVKSLFNPVYGVGKQGIDRLSAEMAPSLAPYNIHVVSLWPGLVRTETMQKIQESESGKMLKSIWHLSESVYLTGNAIACLAQDPHISNKSGGIHFVADLSHEYGFKDIDGKYATSGRSVRFFVGTCCPSMMNLVPHFFKIPTFMLAYVLSKI
uniref:Dehydrogenase/reductase SDR family member 1 (Trinotate prediction) n=1 Tax=Myxobolus squamalis TaxID=59785 RepID=A0A6B2G2Q5_MYXSQ